MRRGVGRQRLGMFIFWEGWFRVGGFVVRHITSGMLIMGEVSVWGWVTGGVGGSGTAMGDMLIS